ncbi:MAG TPA: hypothetical protein VIL46_18815 [Gemmataceae bacterium]
MISAVVSPETERRLAERAAASGLDLPTFAGRIIEREVSGRPTLDEILAPFREEVAESGLTDEELGEFFEGVLREVRAERKSRREPS